MSHYMDLVAAGLCGKCGNKREEQNRSMCNSCAAIFRERATAKRAKSNTTGMCITCGARPRTAANTHCAECLTRGLELQKRKAAQRKQIGLCPLCGEPAIQGKTICQQCSDRMSEVSSSRYHARRAKGKCNYCDSDPVPGSTMCQYHLDLTKQQRDDLKLEVMNAYGGAKCSWCPETDIRFLEIDHIEGGGRQHLQRENLGRGGHAIRGWLKANNYPPGFRILCRVCNAKAHVERCRATGRNVTQSTAPAEEVKTTCPPPNPPS